MFVIRFFVIFYMLFEWTHGKVFNKCDLAKILKHKHHMSINEVNTWVCIAQYQSNMNSEAVGYDYDGTGYHGLFQISDKYWCSANGIGNVCNMNCAQLRDNDLTDDFVCINNIFEEHQRLSGDGYNAWAAYKNNCRDINRSYATECFLEDSILSKQTPSRYNVPAVRNQPSSKYSNKIYHKCELARELRHIHNIPIEQIATWVCIAQHESNFNTSAVGHLNADGSGDHGLFQISDIYWCSPPGRGWVCGLTCAELEDSDITNDVECIKKIYNEHQRLSGDGFNAWAVYSPHCKGRSDRYVDECFDDEQNSVFPYQYKPADTASSFKFEKTKINNKVIKGKVYQPCELAEELRYKHNIPLNQISNWVCIAYHESRFNTSAVGHLNADGSGDHGLFQISDIYWCSPPGKGWVCGLSCAKLEDSDITDDVECMKKIYQEHERLSGDGFNAWAVYNPYCKDRSEKYIQNCFKDDDIQNSIIPLHIPAITAPTFNSQAKLKKIASGKVYDRCELASELRYKHKIPLNQIANWVCIAKHESNFNTSAVGSGDHGLFQISDIYWCSPPGNGWVCGLSCSQLEDSDITDDVECMKTIYEEHQRLSGDGFNAWAVYRPYCKAKSSQYISGCFDDDEYKQIIKIENDLSSNILDKQKVSTGKIYKRCELAKELHNKHNIPFGQISKWVCIAYHQSQYNTSAVIQSTADGSASHGLFQISDIYWCSPPGNGWACGTSCSNFENSDISDDVACIKKIYEEHEKLSGDGFNAWVVYKQYCRDNSDHYINGCFDQDDTSIFVPNRRTVTTKPTFRKDAHKGSIGKVYNRCELAKELRYKHNIPLEQIATWVCIAKHESSYNTSAVGHLNIDGSGDHGLFQISDIYWCSPPGKGWVCGLSCAKLEDSDITDDVECMKKIYDEHTQLSGDGFNAWAVYRPYCKDRSSHYTEGCFHDDNQILKSETYISKTSYSNIGKGKVYNRCELALELRNKHNIPMDQIANWVCIAKYESSYNTSAVGHLNIDGSGDHGLFQISDIYWCSPPGKGWVCGLSCSRLEDSDISDDVECMKKIYEEHQRLSGDGFNAWAVYNPYCKDRSEQFITSCFDDRNTIVKKTTKTPSHKTISRISTGKIYDRCELAIELRDKHNIPENQIATWVCIAKHESSFNTSAIGRLNSDGSEDHGLFQISDIYWCSPPGKGWVCGLSCSQLEDDDISDDVECMTKIFEEHEQLSGDGFNAWAVYKPYCKGRAEQFTAGCFDYHNTVVKKTTKTPLEKTISKISTDKIYDRCELAKELRDKHNIPEEQIATWVCIAKHESSYNTSAIGRLNSDGSEDHGLFQISDIYWCSPPGKGWVCGLSCSQLEDDDISDDVECMKKIFEEHEKLSGDGFNAWAVYKPYCKGRSDSYTKGCFMDNIALTKSTYNQYTTTFPTITSSRYLTDLSTTNIKPTTSISTLGVFSTTNKNIEIKYKSSTTAKPFSFLSIPTTTRKLAPSTIKSYFDISVPQKTTTTTVRTTTPARTASTAGITSTARTTTTARTTSTAGTTTTVRTTIPAQTTSTPRITSTSRTTTPARTTSTARTTTTARTTSTAGTTTTARITTDALIKPTQTTLNIFDFYLNQFRTKKPFNFDYFPQTTQKPYSTTQHKFNGIEQNHKRLTTYAANKLSLNDHYLNTISTTPKYENVPKKNVQVKNEFSTKPTISTLRTYSTKGTEKSVISTAKSINIPLSTTLKPITTKAEPYFQSSTKSTNKQSIGYYFSTTQKPKSSTAFSLSTSAFERFKFSNPFIQQYNPIKLNVSNNNIFASTFNPFSTKKTVNTSTSNNKQSAASTVLFGSTTQSTINKISTESLRPFSFLQIGEPIKPSVVFPKNDLKIIQNSANSQKSNAYFPKYSTSIYNTSPFPANINQRPRSSTSIKPDSFSLFPSSYTTTKSSIPKTYNNNQRQYSSSLMSTVKLFNIDKNPSSSSRSPFSDLQHTSTMV